VHLSGLIRSMAVEHGFLDKQWAEDLKLIEVEGDGAKWWANLAEDSRIRMSIGLAWEQWYLPQVPGVTHQPGEMSVEGIYMTHDGESLDVVMRERKARHTVALHECKVTTKSITTVGDINFFNAKNWMWLTQVACYCKGLDTLLAYLHILYLYGDYKKPYRPQLHIWRIEFTQKDIDQTWAKVRDYRDDKAAAGLLSI
jgi:hypothetical protein